MFFNKHWNDVACSTHTFHVMKNDFAVGEDIVTSRGLPGSAKQKNNEVQNFHLFLMAYNGYVTIR